MPKSIGDKQADIGEALRDMMNFGPQIKGLINDYRALSLDIVIKHEGYAKLLEESKALEGVDISKVDDKTLDAIVAKVAKEKKSKIKKDFLQAIKKTIADYDAKKNKIGPLLDEFAAQLKANSLVGCNDGKKKIEAHLYIREVRQALTDLGNDEYFAKYR